MSETYVLWERGSSDPLRIRAKDGQTARELFDAAVLLHNLDPARINSFYRAGRRIPPRPEFGGTTPEGALVPGEELIFEMRNLAPLGPDAAMVHAGWFYEGRGPIIDPQALSLSDRAAAALQELEMTGLALIERLADGRYRHTLTYEGLARPEMRRPEAKYGIPFPMVERIVAMEPQPEVGDEGPSGP